LPEIRKPPQAGLAQALKLEPHSSHLKPVAVTGYADPPA